MGGVRKYENGTVSKVLGEIMEDKIRLLLLRYIESEGNIANLEKSGYSYATIAKEYSKLINEELIVANRQLEFELSDKGYIELQKLDLEIKKRGILEIEPFNKYKVQKLDKYDIYIE